MKVLILILAVISLSQSNINFLRKQQNINKINELFFNLVNGTIQQQNDSFICRKCEQFFNKIASIGQNHKFDQISEWFGEKICKKFMDIAACKGIIQKIGPEFLQNIFKKFSDGKYLCSKIDLCQYKVKKLKVEDFYKRIMNIPNGQQISKNSQNNLRNQKQLRVLQLSDIHLDDKYLEGAEAFCDEPFCCRRQNGIPKENSQKCGKWGTLAQSDIPLRTLNKTFDFISENIEFDFVIWTGDNIAHDLWYQQKSNQTKPTLQIAQIFKEKFPNKHIYPVIGNHESFPADEFSFAGDSQWLLQQLGDIWKEFIGDEAYEQFLNYGYYTLIDKQSGFRILALNSQAYDIVDSFLFDNPTDPGNQIEFIIKTLTQAEKDNEKVFIIGHIPPGDVSASYHYSKRYNILIERFQHIIKAQIFAHTHNDHFQISRGFIDKQPKGFQLIAPSLTTFSYLNPSFRIYNFNKELELIDYSQYRLNLTEANNQNNETLVYQKVYQFSELYERNISISSLEQISKEIQINKTTQINFLQNYYSNGPLFTNFTMKTQKKQEKEYLNHFCYTQNSDYDQQMKCLGPLHNIEEENYGYVFLQMMIGEWFEYNQDITIKI